MPSFRSLLKKTGLSLTALLIALSSIPAASFADDCKPPDSSQPGVHSPIGADAGAFAYQCDGPYAGQWISAYYVYNPDTNSQSPLYSPDYQYNCTTGKWTKAEWDYAAADGLYHFSRVATSAPGGVYIDCDSDGPGYVGASSISNTGPGSNNTGSNTTNNNATLNSGTIASLNNFLNATANTGNAGVLSNTAGGSAGTGDAEDLANVVNMLQSSSDALGNGKLVTFVANIDGDVNGDFLLDPATLTSIQGTGPGSKNTTNDNLNNNLTLNNSVDAAINNTVDLTAKSGDATVADNTTAGDAKTGNAKTIANIVNLINSSLQSGHSFLGVININGNLNGDILLPDDFIDQLIAANVPTVTITVPGSTNNINGTTNNNSTVTNSNDLGITNNVNSNAGSGTADVTGNTSGGNATTGNAKTSITAFNLTGSNVIGTNDILVFVNVLGKWYGLIVNAPPGSTAASLGGHISNSGPGSSNNENYTTNNNSTLNNDVHQRINNNINTNAHSGNARVSGNTKGGNATSGDAESAINLLNMENSTLDLSGWFGILFINVFGTWNGSFGINTAAGNYIGGYGSGPDTDGATSVGVPSQLFAYLPHDSNHHGGSYSFGPYNLTDAGPAGSNSAVLAAAHAPGTPVAQQLPSHSSSKPTLIIMSGVALYIIADAIYTRRKATLSK